MATEKQLAANELYVGLISEVKLRIAAIDACTSGTMPLAGPFITEFCFLQLRMICETVALACLTAHGDLDLKKWVKKEWNAEKIMDELEVLHPDFFPSAVKVERTKEYVEISPITGRMTKKELLDLYTECGRYLHRGTHRKILKQRMPVQINFPQITSRAQKIVDLLESHTIVMLGGEMAFYVLWGAPGQPATSAIGEKVEHGPP